MNKKDKQRLQNNTRVLDKIKYGIWYECQDEDRFWAENGDDEICGLTRLRIPLFAGLTVSVVCGPYTHSTPTDATRLKEVTHWELYPIFCEKSDYWNFVSTAFRDKRNLKCLKDLLEKEPYFKEVDTADYISTQDVQDIFTKACKIKDKEKRKSKGVK